MEEPLVLINRQEPQITILTLNRPGKRNALNFALLDQLKEAIKETEKMDNQRVIILKGSGSHFCAGLDLNETNTPEVMEKSSENLAECLKALYSTPLVTIALVQGAAIAGGAGLMAACDLVVSEENAKIGFPETKRGLVASLMLTVLIRQIRQKDLKELLLVGEFIDAEKAKQFGLVNRVVSADLLYAQGLKLANGVIRGGPEATAATKRFIDELYPSSFEDDIWNALELHRKSRASEEAKEGSQAFLEKREPMWHH